MSARLQLVVYANDTVTDMVMITSTTSLVKRLIPKRKPDFQRASEKVWEIADLKKRIFVNHVLSISEKFAKKHGAIEVVELEGMFAFFGLIAVYNKRRSEKWALVLSSREYSAGDPIWNLEKNS